MSDDAPYSIYTRLPDGQIEGPRFLLWLVKLATHAAAAFLVLCLTRNILLAAVLGGPLVLVAITTRQALHGHWNPLDKLHDLTFAVVPVAGALLYERRLVAGLALLACCVVVQRLTRQYATP